MSICAVVVAAEISLLTPFEGPHYAFRSLARLWYVTSKRTAPSLTTH